MPDPATRVIDLTTRDLANLLRPIVRGVLEESAAPDGRTAEAHSPDALAYMSEKQLRAAVGVSAATTARWREQGLAHCKVGSLLYYRRDAVETFLASHSTA